VDLPFCDDGEFDPLGDLKILEDLVYNQMPSVGIKQELCEPEEEVHDEESSKHQFKSRKEPRERTLLQIERWSTWKKKPLKCKNDQSSRYMSCIRFFPGKYKSWWSNPFKRFNVILKVSFNFICNFLNVFVDRVELNGLDRVQIKEKPPN